MPSNTCPLIPATPPQPPHPRKVVVDFTLVDPTRNTLTNRLLVFELLIRREFVPDQLPSLIETVLTCEDVDDIIRRLPKDDAQTFVDVMDEASSPSTHRRGSTQRIGTYSIRRPGTR